MHSFGKEIQRPPTAAEAAGAGTPVAGNHAMLAGVVVSLQQTRHRNRYLDERRADHSNKIHEGAQAPSAGRDNGSTRVSSFVEDDGGFGAVVAVDRYNGPGEIPVLHVRVSSYIR